MLIQTTQELLDYEGRPIPNGSRNLTLRDAITLALNNNPPNQEPTAQEKMDAFRISSLLFTGPTAELSIEDAAFIKTRSGIVSGALMHGRLCQILESANQIPAENNGAGKPTELASVD